MSTPPAERDWFEIARQSKRPPWEDPYFKERNLSANVDFLLRPLLYSLGIPVDTFTLHVRMSRIAGWTAHVYEQQSDNRLIRPLANYTGQHQVRGCRSTARVNARRRGLESGRVGKPSPLFSFRSKSGGVS